MIGVPRRGWAHRAAALRRAVLAWGFGIAAVLLLLLSFGTPA